MLDHKDFLIGLEDLKNLRAAKKELEADVAEVTEAIDKVVYDLVEYMETTGQHSLKLEGVGLCSLTSTKYYNIDTDDPRAPEAFETWVKGKGDWDLVTALHAKKLHGYYKEKLELNEELPPGVKTFIKNNVTIRGIQ